ncbi:hypothetical protein [uncultured Clostridium sp.]|uniref:hypothetical protein n=1 Tax=uncultured Clostridium sp. TaxID=59620 RepID=UPI0026356A2C|nr:hypothetical protein [uncultured Clostridium sp.]
MEVKYQALREDKEIAINFIEAIFKSKNGRRDLKKDEMLEKDILALVEEGITKVEIRKRLGITEYKLYDILSNLT